MSKYPGLLPEIRAKAKARGVLPAQELRTLYEFCSSESTVETIRSCPRMRFHNAAATARRRGLIPKMGRGTVLYRGNEELFREILRLLELAEAAGAFLSDRPSDGHRIKRIYDSLVKRHPVDWEHLECKAMADPEKGTKPHPVTPPSDNWDIDGAMTLLGDPEDYQLDTGEYGHLGKPGYIREAITQRFPDAVVSHINANVSMTVKHRREMGWLPKVEVGARSNKRYKNKEYAVEFISDTYAMAALFVCGDPCFTKDTSMGRSKNYMLKVADRFSHVKSRLRFQQRLEQNKEARGEPQAVVPVQMEEHPKDVRRHLVVARTWMMNAYQEIGVAMDKIKNLQESSNSQREDAGDGICAYEGCSKPAKPGCDFHDQTCLALFANDETTRLAGNN